MTTPQLGDEMPAPDGRTLRVVRFTNEVWGTIIECGHCALGQERLNHCRPSAAPALPPFDCVRLPERCIPVFVDDIPLLALKGYLE